MIIIVIVFRKIRDNREVKIKVQRKVICPECKKEIKIGIEEKELSIKNSGINFPHIFLHG